MNENVKIDMKTLDDKSFGENVSSKEQAEAEVVPSSSLVEVEVGLEVGV